MSLHQRAADERWILSTYATLEAALPLRADAYTIALGDIYAGIAFGND